MLLIAQYAIISGAGYWSAKKNCKSGKSVKTGTLQKL